MAPLVDELVCVYCSRTGGAFRTAAGGVPVHVKCTDLYQTVSGALSVKQARKAARAGQRGGRRH